MVPSSSYLNRAPLFCMNGGMLLYEHITHKHAHLVGFLPTATIMSNPIDTPCWVSKTAFLNNSLNSSCEPSNAIDLLAAIAPISSSANRNSSVVALRRSSIGECRLQLTSSRSLDLKIDESSETHLQRIMSQEFLLNFKLRGSTCLKSCPIFCANSSHFDKSSSQFFFSVCWFGAYALIVAQSNSSHCRYPPGSIRCSNHQRRYDNDAHSDEEEKTHLAC